MIERNRMPRWSCLVSSLIALGLLAAAGAFAQGSPAVTLSPSSLTFAQTPLSQKSAAQNVTLTNTGSATLSISSIATGGGNAPKEFTETNTCDSSVAAGANCTISVIFSPFLYGTRTSTLTITDNATGSPQNVTLTGMGMGPAVTLSATSLTFGPQLATTTSAAQMVTLTNSGDAPLTFAASGITVQGNFAETNTCPANPATLGVGSNCAFSITFAPIAGSNTPVPGLIEIMDNASPVPQGISLTGTAQAFTLSASPTTGSVSPGGSANYTISVSPQGGFNAAVSLSCGSPPTGAVCSFSPGSVTPNGSSAITSTLTISTTGSSSAPGGRTRPAPPRGQVLPLMFWFTMILAIGAGLASLGVGERARRRRPAFALAMVGLGALLVALAAPGCGGGSSSSKSSPTPAGNYTVLINGSTPAGSGTYTSPVSVTLTVQ